MKRKRKLVTMLLLMTVTLLALCAPASAEAEHFVSPLEKLRSGVKDLVTFPFELLLQPARRMNETDQKILGFLGGVMEGPAKAGVKILTGIFNVLTFPVI